MPRECITHHHACDCREAEFAAMAERLRDQAAEIARLQTRIDSSPIVKRGQLRSGITPGDYDVPHDWNSGGLPVALVVLE